MATTTQIIHDYTPMPFGKYQGKRIIEVPALYLLWLYNQGCHHTGVRQYIIQNLDALMKEAKIKK